MIETLVALVILAGALAVLLPALSGQVVQLRQARTTRLALIHAQALLDGAIAAHQVNAAESNGTTPDGFTWRQTIQPRLPATATSPAAAEIAVTVAWDNGRRSLTLNGVALTVGR